MTKLAPAMPTELAPAAPWPILGQERAVALLQGAIVRGGVAHAYLFTGAEQSGRATLARLYPGREVVTLDVDAIGEVGGGIHCATQQQPVA